MLGTIPDNGCVTAQLEEHLRSALGGRYTPERELGRGATATVYLAFDARHHRRVALKVLRPEIASALGPERFLREIGIVARLTHPHILPLHDSGSDDGLLWFAMPWVEGETLRDRLRREGQLPVADALHIARGVASALAHAHAHGVIHRDIKPENILLEDGEAVVADFGLARALDAAGVGDTISEPGLVFGTPAYMSPEQASAGQIDARSDIYALGCVLHEMLAGEPPFTGLTTQAVLARQRGDQPRPPSMLRPGLAPELDEAVLAALAKAPADRPRSAQAFAGLLPVVSSTGQVVAGRGSRGARAVAGTDARAGRRRWRLAAGAAVVAVAAAGTAFLVAGTRRVPLDPGLYVVYPFRQGAGGDAAGDAGGRTPSVLSGEEAEMLLHQSVARWSDVRLVDPLWVHDALVRGDEGAAGGGLDAALALARRRGAGRLLTGEVVSGRGRLHVRAAVYDVARGTTALREGVITVRPDLADVDAGFDALARRLLTVPLSGPAADSGSGALGTRSMTAWQAFADGIRALERLDLAVARAGFEAAAARDPQYPQPRLWLAQTMSLAGDAPAEWRELAWAATARSAQLSPPDRRRARALLALAEGRHPAACGEYRAMLRSDSLDFLAWFGLGECQRRDKAVLRDPASPSGWRFRTSDHAAERAYERALRLIPSSYRLFRGEAFARLSDLFVTEPNVFRAGMAPGADGDTLRFGAFPGFAGDTLSYVPYPLEAVFAGAPGTQPRGHAQALAYARGLLRAITGEWARAFPASADAHESYAHVLETLGELDPRAGDAAPEEVRRARALAADGAQRLRLALDDVRLLVKRERFGEARRLGDSLLEAHPAPAPATAVELVGLAALTGRVHLAADLLHRAASVYPLATSDFQPLVLPPRLREALAYRAYAAMGGPADSLRAWPPRIRARIASDAAPEGQAALADALLDQPDALAFAVTGRVPAERPPEWRYLARMQWDLTHGDTAGARARLVALRFGSAAAAPGDVAIDGVYHEARLLLAARDTADAVRLLDRALGALPSLGITLLARVEESAAFVRAMGLRGDLAAAAGDADGARRWGLAVEALWHGADSGVR